jgi:putative glutamine amidotransferase
MPSLKIAIPIPCSRDDRYNAVVLRKFSECLRPHQAELMPIELGSERAALDALSRCQAVILPGSPADIDPARYGAQRSAGLAAPDEPRDVTDEILLRSVMNTGKPILGVCHGLQALNVWCGGGLIQRLPSQTIDHATGEDNILSHAVVVDRETRIWKLLFPDEIGEAMVQVNSNHHQAVLSLGSALRVSARSPDGVVEALEGVDKRHFVLGVQWHPEGMGAESPARRGIFDGFVAAARLGTI